ncbi:CYTH domain-containing protein [Candidatus Gracilibacteria bacterium]|nr:CYTH domain-containing protein [Candidatus Gracilibacteria bacterium]
MLEKEIKILEINKEEIVSKLEAMGAKKSFEGFIHDIYYDFPDDAPKNKMDANGRMFRLRQKGEEHIYTIKNKRKEIKKKEGVVAKDEHETQISNIESFAKVLEKYGMEKTREKKKHRVSYTLENMEFDFDMYEGIPELLEIEGPDGVTIQGWVEKLDLQDYEQMLGGSRKIFKHYGIPYLNID